MDGQDGFWIKSRMTVWGSAGTRCGVALPPLWIADQVRNDVTMLVHRFHPCSRVRHWDRL